MSIELQIQLDQIISDINELKQLTAKHSQMLRNLSESTSSKTYRKNYTREDLESEIQEVLENEWNKLQEPIKARLIAQRFHRRASAIGCNWKDLIDRSKWVEATNTKTTGVVFYPEGYVLPDSFFENLSINKQRYLTDEQFTTGKIPLDEFYMVYSHSEMNKLEKKFGDQPCSREVWEERIREHIDDYRKYGHIEAKTPIKLTQGFDRSIFEKIDISDIKQFFVNL